MKILIVSPFLPPKVGGIERHSAELAAALDVLGHQVIIVTSRLRNSDHHKKNTQIIEIDSWYFLKRIPLPKPSLINSKKIRALSQKHFDQIYVQAHLFPLSTLIASIFGSKNSVTWINHGSNYVPTGITGLNSISKLYEILQMRILDSFTQRLISVSVESARWISKRSRKRSEVIANGIPSLALSAPLSEIRSEEVRILYAGRFVKEKGALESFSIFKQVATYFREHYGLKIELHLVGNGPEFNKVSKLAKATSLPIRTHGEIRQEDLIKIMDKCNIFLYPTKYPEGFPTVILEAGARGMLIVTSQAVPGLLDAVKEGVVYESDFDEIPSTLIELIRKRNQWQVLHIKSRNYFCSKYNWQESAKKYVGRYHD